MTAYKQPTGADVVVLQPSDPANIPPSSTGGTGTGGPESDPVAEPDIAAHKVSTTAHSSDHVSFDDSGLIVVKGLKVKDALAAIDAWTQVVPTHQSGLIAGLPANGARPNGSTWLATDQNSGTTYRMVSGAWLQEAAGVNAASGKIIAGPVQMTGSQQFDVKAVGNVQTDVPGMTLNVPASAGPVLLKATFEIQANTGTAAAAAMVVLQVFITDTANNLIAVAARPLQQVSAASVVLQDTVSLEGYLPAPVVAGTYKIRAATRLAVPANWTSVLLLPGYGTAPVDSFYAQAA